MPTSPCPEARSCSRRLMWWGAALSLSLSGMKALVGIFGRSEALLADGLLSLYLALYCAQSLAPRTETGMLKKFSHRLLSRAVNAFIGIGVLDVMIFSFWKMAKAAGGQLVEPSPLAFLVIAVSLIGNDLLRRYSACLERQPSASRGKELRHGFRLSMKTSAIAFLGVAVSWAGWLAGDALAAIVISGLLIAPLIQLFRNGTRHFTP